MNPAEKKPARRQRKDVQLEAAEMLLGSLKLRFPELVHEVEREMSAVDGYASVVTGNGVIARGSSEMTSTERAADIRMRMGIDLEDLLDLRAAVIELVHTLDRQMWRAAGVRERAAADVARCRDALPGRDGAGEWGDSGCEELPVKAGLCGACYQRERRWRIGHGLTERDTVGPA